MPSASARIVRRTTGQLYVGCGPRFARLLAACGRCSPTASATRGCAATGPLCGLLAASRAARRFAGCSPLRGLLAASRAARRFAGCSPTCVGYSRLRRYWPAPRATRRLRRLLAATPLLARFAGCSPLRGLLADCDGYSRRRRDWPAVRAARRLRRLLAATPLPYWPALRAARRLAGCSPTASATRGCAATGPLCGLLAASRLLADCVGYWPCSARLQPGASRASSTSSCSSRRSRPVARSASSRAQHGE
jgi:hypothetical protein